MTVNIEQDIGGRPVVIVDGHPVFFPMVPAEQTEEFLGKLQEAITNKRR